ncbi:hypothetical protein WJX79_003141 [Trebouxia sp. C0005]
MALSPYSRKPFSRAKDSSGHATGAKGSRKGPVSTHHQLLLLHKGIKKAKQFELRKLIRRLKAAAAASIAGSESRGIQFAAATSERLQAQYDTTKGLRTEVLLQQAASCCGLPEDAAASGQPSNMISKELPETSDQLIQLACSRLLSATCGPLSYLEPGADETSIGPTAGSHEHYSRDAAMSDNEAAQDAKEDRQIAVAAMARLLDKRANTAEQSSTSASDSSAADLPQQSDASYGISCSEADSAEPSMAQTEPANAAWPLSYATSLEATCKTSSAWHEEHTGEGSSSQQGGEQAPSSRASASFLASQTETEASLAHSRTTGQQNYLQR